MDTEQTREIVTRVYSHLAAGKSEEFFFSLATDVQWTVIGSTRFSRRFNGLNEVINEMLTPARTIINGAISITVDAILADGDRAVIQARGSAQTHSGVPYNNTYCWVVRVGEDRQISEVMEYGDTELVTAIFGR